MRWRKMGKEWQWMVDGDDKFYHRNSDGLISAKYHFIAKWCGQHDGVVYFFSNSCPEKAICCLSLRTAVCPDGLLFPPFSDDLVSILTVLNDPPQDLLLVTSQLDNPWAIPPPPPLPLVEEVSLANQVVPLNLWCQCCIARCCCQAQRGLRSFWTAGIKRSPKYPLVTTFGTSSQCHEKLCNNAHPSQQ